MSEDRKKKYLALLQTDEWKAKRLEIMKRDNFTCLDCGAKSNLQVHHIKYINGRMPWDYPNNLLKTLCRECHKNTHDTKEVRSEKDRRPKTTVKEQKRKARKAIKVLSLKELLLKRKSVNEDISVTRNRERRS